MKDPRNLDRKVVILDSDLRDKVIKKLKRLRYQSVEIGSLTGDKLSPNVFGFTAYIFSGNPGADELRKVVTSIPDGCALMIFKEELITTAIMVHGITIVTDQELNITRPLVAEVFKNEGIKISLQDAGYISQLAANASYNGFIELEKIVNFIKAGGTIKDASQVAIQKENFNTFNIINMMLDGRTDKAVSYLHWMVSKGYEERMIIGAFVWFFRKIVAIKHYSGYLDQQTLSKKIGVRFNGHKFIRYAKNNDMQSLRKRIKSLKLADLTLKTSDSSAYPFLCKAIL